MSHFDERFGSGPSYSDAREDPRPMRAEHGGAQYSGNYRESWVTIVLLLKFFNVLHLLCKLY